MKLNREFIREHSKLDLVLESRNFRHHSLRFLSHELASQSLLSHLYGKFGDDKGIYFSNLVQDREEKRQRRFRN